MRGFQTSTSSSAFGKRKSGRASDAAFFNLQVLKPRWKRVGIGSPTPCDQSTTAIKSIRPSSSQRFKVEDEASAFVYHFFLPTKAQARYMQARQQQSKNFPCSECACTVVDNHASSKNK